MNDAGFVGSIPQHYDADMGPFIFADAAAEMARRVAAWHPDEVLETAAGTGIVTRALRDALPAKTRIVATDLNPPMLDVARPKFGPQDNVEILMADAMDLPFASDRFDLVICQFGVMFFPDQGKGYREAKRVLRSGGHYLFSVWDSHAHNPFGRIAHETVARFFPNDPPQFQRLPFSYTAEAGQEGLDAAGFAAIEVSVVSLEKALPDPAQLARGIVFGSPLYDQILTRGGVQPDAIVDAITAGFRAAFPDGTMRLQALMFSALKP